MKPPSATTVKAVVFVVFVIALVSIPFVILGEERSEALTRSILHSQGNHAVAMSLIAIGLLAADSVAPVPATIVLWILAHEAGLLAGIVGGTIGLSLGVLTAAWLGRTAVGRLAPKFFPDAELARLRTLLQSRLMVTLACLRSVPVLAETSVIAAAAMGIPVRRIFWASLLPNFIVATIYSIAADSWQTATIAFFGTMIASYVLWRWLGRGKDSAP
ncbi:MAG TPA: hypothetical protein VM029_10745 [Opitutaceae bacterium]|nr:hypothetical protein [Opitutaceae bacterium]